MMLIYNILLCRSQKVECMYLNTIIINLPPDLIVLRSTITRLNGSTYFKIWTFHPVPFLHYNIILLGLLGGRFNSYTIFYMCCGCVKTHEYSNKTIGQQIEYLDFKTSECPFVASHAYNKS